MHESYKIRDFLQLVPASTSNATGWIADPGL
jgi:hypothetical protein